MQENISQNNMFSTNSGKKRFKKIQPLLEAIAKKPKAPDGL